MSSVLCVRRCWTWGALAARATMTSSQIAITVLGLRTHSLMARCISGNPSNLPPAEGCRRTALVALRIHAYPPAPGAAVRYVTVWCNDLWWVARPSSDLWSPGRPRPAEAGRGAAKARSGGARERHGAVRRLVGSRTQRVLDEPEHGLVIREVDGVDRVGRC